MNKRSNQLLKSALTSNAVFSIVSGIVLIILNTSFKTWFGLDFPFWIIGVGLIPFGILGYQSSRDTENMVKKGQIITIMDILWVIGSMIIILLVDMTQTGQWIIGIVAMIVADFAFFQYLGMKRLQ